MNLTALRVERIRMGVQAAERLVDLQTRRHTGVLVVGLTFVGTALAGGLGGQLSTLSASALLTVGVGVVASQLRRLARLASEWRQVMKEAVAAIDALIEQEVASDADEQASNAC